MTAICVIVKAAYGSTPRETGTAMLVYADRICGTIGGGALEWAAMAQARDMLAQNDMGRVERRFALGPALNQCCGGAVTLMFEKATQLPTANITPLWVWGAGHVGRAVVAVLAPLPHFTITWIDISIDRFPADGIAGVERVVAADPSRLMAHTPVGAHHLIFTYSHDIDFALCHAALNHGFASCGLIGSSTKWARFQNRLRQLGHSDVHISRITCPIGDPSLGKHPHAIAVGVASQLLHNHRVNAAPNIPQAMAG